MSYDITALNEKIRQESAFIQSIMFEAQKIMVGQRYLMERIMIGILANGHILLESVPGLAKTTAVKTIAQTIHAKFQRIQFTPDMLPADLTGTLIYDPKTLDFKIQRGPIFASIILADEINRAPAKVQSALLEAMAERQVTIGTETMKMDDLFLVMATQNPIEQEGTYRLPEAQVDRFMLKVVIDYPSKEEEYEILKRMAFTNTRIEINPVVSPKDILRVRTLVDDIYIDEKVQRYIVDIVEATRYPEKFGMPEMKNLIQYGGSPRATINLTLAAKAYAFLQGRGYVTPQDVKSIGLDVLRHRVILSYEAEAEEKTSDDLIAKIFNEVPVP